MTRYAPEHPNLPGVTPPDPGEKVKEVPMKIKRMKRRTATLAAAGMAAGALFAVAVPGTAEAQSGSRICGNYWKV